ncbi:hypothetical protein PIB30_059459 [Stylosanthes scabra]|uniref:Uncharacterized protein n=1 Tax=Stylosanthes scabra TaxID=79078 RepID=A0ABU6XKK4_9FABA|nr:hypothetical protein [Stylosanthes scabra]
MKRLRSEEHSGKRDLEDLTSTWKVSAARYMQVQAARFMCISRAMEIQAVEEETKRAEHLREIMEREEKLKLAQEQLSLKEKEIGELKEAMTKHDYQMYAAGWGRAKEQVELLAPGVNFERMDLMKVVYKGALVNVDQVPVDGSDDHNPGE